MNKNHIILTVDYIVPNRIAKHEHTIKISSAEHMSRLIQGNYNVVRTILSFCKKARFNVADINCSSSRLQTICRIRRGSKIVKLVIRMKYSNDATKQYYRIDRVDYDVKQGPVQIYERLNEVY